MTAFFSLPITYYQGAPGALRGLLSRLLELKQVDAVLVALTTRDGRSIQPALVTEPARMALANPLMPVLPINMARMAALITERSAPSANGNSAAKPRRIAVVMRPCELRAAVELAKLKQLRLDQLLTIGVDCVGTFEAVDLRLTERDPDSVLRAMLDAARAASPDAPAGLPYRHACSICETPVAWNADISLHTVGVDTSRHLYVEMADSSLGEALGLGPGADRAAHEAGVRALADARHERRTRELDNMVRRLQPREDGTPGLLEEFEECQGCHNCTVACPICYCKECLFRTNTFAYEPRRYFGWANRKGAARLPGDTIAFQLTRLSHMSTSCVGCGLCTSACPAHLPVDSLFQAVARRTQGLFDYVPGRDIEETIPLAAFRQDEFVVLGETAH